MTKKNCDHGKDFWQCVLCLSLEVERLRHLKGDEALQCLETVAAAGARLTRLAGGGAADCGDVQFASKDGMFSESIAHQRIRWLLKCREAAERAGVLPCV